MNYVIYARRSSDGEDHQTLSIESQLDELRQFAASRGIEISQELTESASARDPGRPVFNQLMTLIRQGKVNGVLVWRLDRLARNMVDAGAIIYELDRGKLQEIITPEATYAATGDAKFALALQFGSAAKYVDDLAAAVRRGNQEVLRQGKVPGPVPLGYMKTHEHELIPGSGTAIPDPERFETVKKLWTAILHGERNLSQLWRTARYDWGLTTRPKKGTLAHPITLGNIYALLKNPFYAGKIRHGDELYKGEHPPMVTWEQFQMVQRLFEKHEHAAAPPPHHDFLYHGLVRCGACGRGCTGEEHLKPSGKRFIYYRCSRRRPGYLICRAPAISEDDLTSHLTNLLDTVTIDPQVREWAYEAVAWWANDEPSPEKAVRRAKYALKAAEDRLATLTDMTVAGILTRAEYKVRRVNLLVKIDHLREALASPAEKLAAWRLLREEKQKNGLKLGQDFQNGDNETKRKIVVRTIASITVTDRKPMVELRSPFVTRAHVQVLQDGLTEKEKGHELDAK